MAWETQRLNPFTPRVSSVELFLDYQAVGEGVFFYIEDPGDSQGSPLPLTDVLRRAHWPETGGASA